MKPVHRTGVGDLVQVGEAVAAADTRVHREGTLDYDLCSSRTLLMTKALDKLHLVFCDWMTYVSTAWVAIPPKLYRTAEHTRRHNQS
jgi:hypothetical protein